MITLSVLFILIAISMVLAGAFLFAFFWNVNTGQFDDDYTPSVRVLFDSEPNKKESSNKTIIENAG